MDGARGASPRPQSHPPTDHEPQNAATAPAASPIRSRSAASNAESYHDPDAGIQKLGDPGPSSSRSPHLAPAPLPRSESSNAADDDQDEYERLRRLNMAKNDSLLAQLGLTSSFSLFPSRPGSQQKQKGGQPTARRPKAHREVRDRSGYVISLPPTGKRQRLACVDIDNGLRSTRSVDTSKYKDRTHWALGEERRWKFGGGQGGEPEAGTDDFVGGVGADFRWRTWEEIEAEELAKGAVVLADESDDDDAVSVETPAPVPRVPKEKVPYSEIEGEPCHQCRRKSNKPKMRCRNVDPECNFLFCSTCCKRYDFEFDEDSRSFICPFCLGICNCSGCLRKCNLGHLVVAGPFGAAGVRGEADRMGQTVQAYLSQQIEREPEFDRVRVVCREEDVVSIPLPLEWLEWIQNQKKSKRPQTGRRTGGEGRGGEKKPRKSTAKDGAGGEDGSKSPKKKRKKTTSKSADAPKSPTDETTQPPIMLRMPAMQSLQPAPPPPPPKEKEVDSDGDTVDGYSDNDAGGNYPRALYTTRPLRASTASSETSNRVQTPSPAPAPPPMTLGNWGGTTLPPDWGPTYAFSSDVPNLHINDYLASLQPLPQERALVDVAALAAAGSSPAAPAVDGDTEMGTTDNTPVEVDGTMPGDGMMSGGGTMSGGTPEVGNITFTTAPTGLMGSILDDEAPRMTPHSSTPVASQEHGRERSERDLRGRDFDREHDRPKHSRAPSTGGPGLSLSRLLPDGMLVSSAHPLADVYLGPQEARHESPPAPEPQWNGANGHTGHGQGHSYGSRDQGYGQGRGPGRDGYGQGNGYSQSQSDNQSYSQSQSVSPQAPSHSYNQGNGYGSGYTSAAATPAADDRRLSPTVPAAAAAPRYRTASSEHIHRPPPTLEILWAPEFARGPALPTQTQPQAPQQTTHSLAYSQAETHMYYNSSQPTQSADADKGGLGSYSQQQPQSHAASYTAQQQQQQPPAHLVPSQAYTSGYTHSQSTHTQSAHSNSNSTSYTQSQQHASGYPHLHPHQQQPHHQRQQHSHSQHRQQHSHTTYPPQHQQQQYSNSSQSQHWHLR